MALSRKDWELPNSRIWLAELDIDRGLDFPSRLASTRVMFYSEKLQTKKQNHWLFPSNNISFCKWQKADEKRKLYLSLPYNKHLINRAKSVCMGESWPRSCVQTSLRSVCTYDLGQDSPIQTDLARLIRANYCWVRGGVGVQLPRYSYWSANGNKFIWQSKTG